MSIEPQGAPAKKAEGSFTDGEWHHLHPATPLLRGGISLVAIIGVVVVQLRDTFLNSALGTPDEDEPFAWILEHQLFLPIALVVLLGLGLFVAGFYVSWRMHTFRITEEVVEVRSGVLFRTNRKARLDRIQGVNIIRPFFARLFGAAKLEVNVAGQDANVQLAYLGSAASDRLRHEVLRLASGTRAESKQAASGGEGVPHPRVAELLAPELDPALASRESVVSIPIGRLIGSILLSGFTLTVAGVFVGAIVSIAITGNIGFLFFFLPGLIGVASFYWSKFTKSLRYTIAGTPDGIRIGFGLLSTSNDTLPPGRIHAVQISQPLLWRIAGWWEIKVNRAANSSAKGAGGQSNTTILPVGDLADVMKVLELVLPAFSAAELKQLLERGLLSPGGDDGFTNSPPRAAALRWFSWRRNGFALAEDSVLLRTGVIWRQLVVVPLARLQSVALQTGPLRKRLRLASLRLHTVNGPVRPAIGAVDAGVASAFLLVTAAAAIRSASSDTSQRWRSSEQV